MSEQTPNILSKIKQGDHAAFEHLFREKYESLVGFARKFIQDQDECEGVVQDMFVSFWEKREEISVDTSISGYLYSSVRNRCLNLIKHDKVKQEHVAYQKAKPIQTQDGGDRVLEASELQSRIDDAIANMPDKRQEIFLLSRYEGLKYSEIAKQLNISVKTVEAQMGKALKYLREELKDYLPVLFLFPEIAKIFLDLQ